MLQAAETMLVVSLLDIWEEDQNINLESIEISRTLRQLRHSDGVGNLVAKKMATVISEQFKNQIATCLTYAEKITELEIMAMGYPETSRPHILRVNQCLENISIDALNDSSAAKTEIKRVFARQLTFKVI